VIDPTDVAGLSSVSATHSHADTRQQRANRLDQALKTVMDYGLTLVGLLLIGPVMLVLALIVRLDSPGPVIYRRRVIGRGGKQFDAFKFRTMRIDGEAILANRPDLQAELAANHKLTHDPRITGCGHWLRKLSLDELPQLFNVLRGEMSLVGPRMISPPELARYGDYARELVTVKPALTGLWQVSGRSNLAPGERVALDIQYVRTRTVWMDALLLLQTIPAVLKGRGAM
jgi:lipopolysaccharide/colanic/teichoic acid biosynthesis glycosyltransferase